MRLVQLQFFVLAILGCGKDVAEPPEFRSECASTWEYNLCFEPCDTPEYAAYTTAYLEYMAEELAVPEQQLRQVWSEGQRADDAASSKQQMFFESGWLVAEVTTDLPHADTNDKDALVGHFRDKAVPVYALTASTRVMDWAAVAGHVDACEDELQVRFDQEDWCFPRVSRESVAFSLASQPDADGAQGFLDLIVAGADLTAECYFATGTP